MNNIPTKKEMDPKAKAIAIIFILLIIGMVVGLILSYISIGFVEERARNLNRNIEPYLNLYADMYTLHTTIICINIFLLIGLLGIYLDSFRKTHSTFIMGLILFLGVLLVQSILSLQVLHAVASAIKDIPGLLDVLPNMFETIALIILSYLSME